MDTQDKFNPWLMQNLNVSQQITVMTPSGWYEVDCFSDDGDD